MSSVNWWMRKSFCGSFPCTASCDSHAETALTSRASTCPITWPGHLARPHPPLGVEGEADVGLLEPALEAPRLGEEVRAPGLDVEHQQRLRLARRAEVAVDDRGVLARVVALALARVGGGGDRDQLHGGEHRAPRGRVRLAPGARAAAPRAPACRSRARRARRPAARRSRRRSAGPAAAARPPRGSSASLGAARFFALAACFAGVPPPPPASSATAPATISSRTPSATRRRRRKTAGLGGAVATAQVVPVIDRAGSRGRAACAPACRDPASAAAPRRAARGRAARSRRGSGRPRP